MAEKNENQIYWEKINETVSDYIDGYDFRGDGGDYTLSEKERILIEDCVAGLLGELPLGPQKKFPMQGGPDIDWKTAEIIYEMYSTLHGNRQSLERLAERGGFGWSEVEHLQKQFNKSCAGHKVQGE